MNSSAINYYIKEDVVAITKQQDVATFNLYTVGYLYYIYTQQDETGRVLSYWV